MNSNWISYIILIIGASILSWGIYNSWQKPENTLWVGVSADYKPFAFKEKSELKGFDIDLVKQLGERLGKSVVFKEYSFPSLIVSLRSGKLDFVVSGISPTPQKSVVVDFSKPYFKDGYCVITKNKSLNSLSDLKGLRSGVQLGSVVESVAKKWCEKYSIKIIAYDLNTQILQTLKSGHLDALFIAHNEGRAIVRENPSLHMFCPSEDCELEELAIAFPKGSSLVAQVDEVLKKLEDEGVLDSLKKVYELE